MDATLELRIPQIFEKTSEGPRKTIYRGDIPWLPGESEIIKLKKVDFQGHRSCYVASAVRGRKLTDAASSLNRKKSDIANRLFYGCLPDFISNGYNAHVKRTDKQKTTQPIFYTGNPDGQRVYFMRLDNLNGIPVILKIAACDKTKQADVMSVIADTDKSSARRRINR